MKTKSNLARRVACLLLALSVQHQFPAFAQSAAVIFQGRVTAGGTNFSGTGQFKFALVTSSNTSAQATATANRIGPTVTSYNLLSGGSGYTSAPAVTVSGGGGSGATAIAFVSGGIVTGVFPVSLGSGYTSTPTVTIAAPPANLVEITHWSNDGTSSAGSEPLTAVPVPVAGGLFTVPLGDTSLSNMIAVNVSLFAQQHLQLQIWFSDGLSGFARLNPAQRLTLAPYAAFAHSASNLSGTLPVAKLTGTIPASQLPASVVTNNASGLTLNGTFAGNGAGVTNVALASLNSAEAITWPGTFLLTSSAAVGNAPYEVTAADVNGDGRPDVITANHDANNLSVLTNDGHGRFVLASSPAVGLQTWSVTAADVNGDGKLDLISGDYVANTLWILTNISGGHFALAATPLVGNGPISVVTADANGDGKRDIISANYLSSSLSILTNNGLGTFTLAASTSVGAGPFSVTAADVNGDGKMDFITANWGADTLSVLTNNGGGGFVLASSPSPGAGSDPISVAAADVNGDGKVDLISANSSLGTLSVFTNAGNGTFALASSPGVGFSPYSVKTANLNDDVAVDLVSANYSTSTLSILTNNGSGGFTLAASPGVGTGSRSVTTADVNGDGKLDLISANRVDDTISVLLNRPRFQGSFTGAFDGVATGSASFSGDIRLNDHALYLRADNSHGLGWFGSGQPFANTSAIDGPVLFGFAGGALGTRQLGTEKIALSWDSDGVVIGKSFAGGGGGLTNLNASQLTSGTVPDGRLSANVASRSGGNAFTGNQSVLGGTVGIGTTSPAAQFEVSGGGGDAAPQMRINQTSFTDYARLRFTVGGDTSKRWDFASVSNLFVIYSGQFSAEMLRLDSAGLTVRGTFVSSSDRNAKENFKPVDHQAVLEKVASLPLAEWNYKQDGATRHIGPMAQDFHAAFGLGADDKHIATVDADGVALAAIQALHQKVEAQHVELRDRNKRIAELETRLERLENLLSETRAK